MAKATFHSVTPLIPAGADIASELEYYVSRLGFTVDWQNGGAAGIHRDDVSFLLMQNTNREWADNSSFGVGVSDLQALHQEFATNGARVGAIEKKPWGRTEFHLIVPSGVCFQFFNKAE